LRKRLSSFSCDSPSLNLTVASLTHLLLLRIINWSEPTGAFPDQAPD
jgi:hypothetical protein